MVKGFKLFMACKEQFALHLPCKIIIQKLVLRPWHSYFHYHLLLRLFHPSKQRSRGAFSAGWSVFVKWRGRGGEGGERSHRQAVNGSSKIVYRFHVVSRVWVKQTSRFIGFWGFGFSSVLCCFFYLMLQLFGHQIYCAPSNNCIYFRARLKRTILKGFKRF